MSIDNIANREELKERLIHIRDYYSDQQDTTYRFAALLGINLPEGEISPEIFVSYAVSLLRELEKGTYKPPEGTNNPFSTPLPGFMSYNLMKKIPKIVNAISPGKFAEDVQYEINDIDETLKAYSSETK